MALSYFLAFFILTFLLVAGQTPKYVLKGEGDHLKPNIPGQPSSILWKHNGNKIVEFDGSEEQVYGQYRNRIKLNWITAELKITDLRYEDSGDYKLEVDINNELYSSQSKLEVIDKVATPTISCALNKGSSTDGSEIKATLLCSAKPRKPESLMKFEWSSQGKLHPGNKLPISLGDTETDEEYVCIVRNPLSTDKATFRAKDCYHEKNSSIALGVGLFFLFLSLGAVVGSVVFLKWKQKACFAKGQQGDVEKQSPAKGPGQKAEQTEERRPLRGGRDRAKNPSIYQPLYHLPQNHETKPDELTAGQKEPENNQRECEEAPSVPDTKNELHDSQPKSPLTEDSAGLDPKESDGEQQTESTAETAATTANKSNQGGQESKNEPDESDGENSSKVPDSEDSDQQQEKSSNEPENNSNIKETNSQKSVAPGTPALSEDVSDGGETDKKLDSATSQQPKNTTPTGDPSTTGEDNQPLHQKT